jgi:ABC-type phosphate/phosphonate transport system substrate-binding protein
MKLSHLIGGLALIASTSSCTRTNAQQLQATAAWSPEDTRDINFLSYLPDKDTEEADKRLKQFLEVSIRESMAAQNREIPRSDYADEPVRLSAQPKQYEEIIRAFAERRHQRIVARITPYAYVAAEMLGAKFDILAVYRSEATQSTTYQSWFVVRRADLVAQMCESADKEAALLNDIQATSPPMGPIESRRLPTQKDAVRDALELCRETGKGTSHLEHFTPVSAHDDATSERRQRGQRERKIQAQLGRLIDIGGEEEPTLKELAEYLHWRADANKPASFVFHDRFSTSSFFLPSMYFKSVGVFDRNQTTNVEGIPIEARQLPSASSTTLVSEVAEGRADVAAVWDGTKSKFMNATMGTSRYLANQKVAFIPIVPNILPNDLLVASGVAPWIRNALTNAIASDATAGRGKGEGHPSDDFLAWHVWDNTEVGDATDVAREALAKLRQDARQPPAPVVVRVTGDQSIDPRYINAAKEAVRLSGTEFVLEARDLHRQVDMIWTLSSLHDGALSLTCTLAGENELEGPFTAAANTLPISFVDDTDLPQRIADLARSRLMRIRYVWPYEERFPAVLRDLDFTPDRDVLVQKVSWIDQTHNAYTPGTPFHARIENPKDFDKFRLSDDLRFPRNNDGGFNFNPMGNDAYRVVIARQARPGVVLTALPAAFVLLFAAAAIGLVLDARRKDPPPSGLAQSYRQRVAEYHSWWRDHDLQDREILWFDGKAFTEFIKEARLGGVSQLVRSGGFDFTLAGLPIRFWVVTQLLARMFNQQARLAGELIDASEASSVAALQRAVQYLLCGGRLAPFVGFPERFEDATPSSEIAHPLEWVALSDVASRRFAELGIAGDHDVVLDARNSSLSLVVSNHFRGVINRGMREAVLFRQTWTVSDDGATLAYTTPLHTPLRIGNGSQMVSIARIEVVLSNGNALRQTVHTPISAWVFGRINDTLTEGDMLVLRIKPLAVLATDAH